MNKDVGSDFWLVHIPSKGFPTKAHVSEEEAITEAIRLATKEKLDAHVYRCVAVATVVIPPPVVITSPAVKQKDTTLTDVKPSDSAEACYWYFGQVQGVNVYVAVNKNSRVLEWWEGGVEDIMLAPTTIWTRTYLAQSGFVMCTREYFDAHKRDMAARKRCAKQMVACVNKALNKLQEKEKGKGKIGK